MTRLEGYPHFDLMTFFVWEVTHSGKKLPNNLQHYWTMNFKDETVTKDKNKKEDNATQQNS